MLFAIGTIVSLIAAIIIELFLVLMLVFNFSIICSQIGIVGGFLLIPLAFTSLYSYARSSRHAKSYMLTIAPIGVLLGLAAFIMVITGYSCPLGPLRVLALAYIMESIVGYYLRLDFQVYSRLFPKVFLLGIILFTAGLLLLNISTHFILLSLLGNTVKLLSLIPLTAMVLKRSPQL